MADIVASACIGATAGIAEVSFNQPLIYFKNCLQTKTPIQLKPSVLYRGYGTNVATVAPITSLQVAMSAFMYKTLFAKGNRDNNITTPHLYQTALASTIAGAISGVVAGPSETVILQQQRTGASAIDTMKKMYAENGLRALFRGTQPAMIRDGLFSCGFIAVVPFLTDCLHQYSMFNDFTAPLAGGLIAGLGITVLTHPFDTLKTRYQNDYTAKKYPNFLHVVKDGNLFQGVSARGTRVITGTIIISNVTRLMNREYQQRIVNKRAATDKVLI